MVSMADFKVCYETTRQPKQNEHYSSAIRGIGRNQRQSKDKLEFIFIIAGILAATFGYSQFRKPSLTLDLECCCPGFRATR